MKWMIKSAEDAKIERANRDSYALTAMEVMRDSEDMQDDPEVGIFWYDVNRHELFGVESQFSSEMPWYHSNQLNADVRTCRKLHKAVWKKENFRGRDKRFSGDHTLTPRGRVFEFKDSGFKVYVGDWIDKYPEAKDEILFEFNLPEDTEFVKDVHWDLGHGWTDEF